MPRLGWLNLRNNGRWPAAVERLAACLRASTSLTELRLGGNAIGGGVATGDECRGTSNFAQ